MIGSGFAWQREMACCQVVSCPVGVRKLHCFQGHVFRGKRRVGWKSGRQQVCRCQVDDNEVCVLIYGSPCFPCFGTQFINMQIFSLLRACGSENKA